MGAVVATIGIRQSAWDSGTADQRRVIKVFADWVDVGEPVLYKAGATVWLIADDWRINATDVAVFGKILGLLAQFDVIPNGDSITRSRLKTWITNHGGIVIPATIPDGEDPYDYIYQQNGGPAFGAARSQVPVGLTPIQG